MKQPIPTIVFIFLSLCAQAHNGYIDSLQRVLKQASDFNKKIAIQQQIADWYRSSEQYSEAISMANLSLQNSLDISSHNLDVTRSYWLLSNIYTNMENFEMAREYVDKAYQSAEAQNSPLPMAYAHYAEVILQRTLFDADIPIQKLHEALSKIKHPKE
ncbi:tetratricopeptide repeat protein [Sphingobacterium wenxiniae]|uniref:Tetratricopeptide repeat-containing protein n=1 Tax=Sphingobacterium wenxiniae TaxID=683125 RepID=A0A1I6SQ14_9SPHI|nr:tetratricopeptide repeat protein [Sphingobacterium wenxiniae]SFS79032.1 hypothetical protein SAMN05660206_10525 [Sphingobacterium wenxiniae]